MEMVDESKSVVEAIDRIRGALAPDKSEQSSDSVIQALDRIYEVLKPKGPGDPNSQDNGP
jgi:hypothetical protein